ncbi:unnamed protein product [Durusdinium trenchii]
MAGWFQTGPHPCASPQSVPQKLAATAFLPEAEKPPMPRGVSSSRLPPPVMSDPPRSPSDSNGFLVDDFVVPPDTVNGHPGLQNSAAMRVLQSMNAGSERRHFPEIVRLQQSGLDMVTEDSLCKVPM